MFRETGYFLIYKTSFLLKNGNKLTNKKFRQTSTFSEDSTDGGSKQKQKTKKKSLIYNGRVSCVKALMTILYSKE